MLICGRYVCDVIHTNARPSAFHTAIFTQQERKERIPAILFLTILSNIADPMHNG